jgi:hypothetical protein
LTLVATFELLQLAPAFALGTAAETGIEVREVLNSTAAAIANNFFMVSPKPRECFCVYCTGGTEEDATKT